MAAAALLLAGAALFRAAAAEPAALSLPLSPACISSPFGPRSNAGPRASTFHNGVDIPAPAGAWVRAAAAGEVVAIRRTTRAGAGLEVELRHADGRVTRYAHLGTVAPKLASGQRRVAAGEPIGRIGRTGITYGTHLHLELLVDGQRVDPAPAFGLQPCPPR
jgi:murein DD-endopeptidase MepM/ murein hydrolase activator NlpD